MSAGWKIADEAKLNLIPVSTYEKEPVPKNRLYPILASTYLGGVVLSVVGAVPGLFVQLSMNGFRVCWP